MVIVDGYELDLSLVEDHTRTSDITSHPVERGSDFTDHIKPRRPVVTMTGVVSNTPIGRIAIERGETTRPSDDAYAVLKRLHEAGDVFVVTTELENYEDMAIDSLSIPRSAQIGDSLQFDVTFKQLEIVDTERAIVRVTLPRARGRTRRGQKPNRPVFDSQTLILGATAQVAAINAKVAASQRGDRAPAPSTKDQRNVKSLQGSRKLVRSKQDRVPIASGGGTP